MGIQSFRPVSSEIAVNNLMAIYGVSTTHSYSSAVADDEYIYFGSTKTSTAPFIMRMDQRGYFSSFKIRSTAFSSNAGVNQIIKSGNRLIASVTGGSSTQKGLYYSDDKGETWTQSSLSQAINSDNVKSTVYSNGLGDVCFFDWNSAFYYSHDNGSSFTRLSGGYGIGSGPMCVVNGIFKRYGFDSVQFFVHTSADGQNWDFQTVGYSHETTSSNADYAFARSNGDVMISFTGYAGDSSPVTAPQLARIFNDGDNGLARLEYQYESSAMINTTVNTNDFDIRGMGEIDGKLIVICRNAVIHEKIPSSYVFHNYPAIGGTNFGFSNPSNSIVEFNSRLYIGGGGGQIYTTLEE